MNYVLPERFLAAFSLDNRRMEARACATERERESARNGEILNQ